VKYFSNFAALICSFSMTGLPTLALALAGFTSRSFSAGWLCQP